MILLMRPSKCDHQHRHVASIPVHSLASQCTTMIRVHCLTYIAVPYHDPSALSCTPAHSHHHSALSCSSAHSHNSSALSYIPVHSDDGIALSYFPVHFMHPCALSCIPVLSHDPSALSYIVYFDDGSVLSSIPVHFHDPSERWWCETDTVAKYTWIMGVHRDACECTVVMRIRMGA